MHVTDISCFVYIDQWYEIDYGWKDANTPRVSLMIHQYITLSGYTNCCDRHSLRATNYIYELKIKMWTFYFEVVSLRDDLLQE